MTNAQLYLAIGVPVALNALMLGILIAYMNSSIGALGASVAVNIAAVNKRIDDLRGDVNRQFDLINKQFDVLRAEMLGLHADLRRVEDRIHSPIFRP